MRASDEKSTPGHPPAKTRIFELPYLTLRRIRLERRFQALRAVALREPPVKAEAA